MFRAKTVLVIGAGASVEVGLPMGSELLKQIVKLTDIKFDHYTQKSGDPAILEALKIILNEGREVTKVNEHLHAAWQLGESASQAISIDNVIDALEDPKVELVGKLGIVQAILKAEAASPAFKRVQNMPDAIDLSKFSDAWYSSLTKLLTENVRKSEVGSIFDDLEIVNFNYDRCLEHYLPFSLASYYGLQADAIREIMQGLTIHRPYGVAGRLPWQKGDGPSVGFGQGSPQQLADVAQQVRTFTERVEEGEELAAMRATMAGADRVIFLGFAFHRQNVELLAQQVQDHTEVVATAFGISKSDKAVIDDELQKAFQFQGILNEHRIELADMTCNQFFKEYWRTLTAEKSDSERVEMPDPYAGIDRMMPRLPAGIFGGIGHMGDD
ncbi:hypothetical protein [Novosphingobium malaysiense]|uniref:SIR2-like domain-containing protein n=1 Tax=Novosphingobium malaysiense TaxID=1348853 RepID=A0A0B1ZQP1_9SPHN|nr:hypothetical protein [Novosphingobium malaysiense]KHK92916.1 hypothetical protein LK12_00520 [Novosphingobium malaysiense]